MQYTRHDIIEMLLSEGSEQQKLFHRAKKIKHDTIGDSIYLRGLIEYSNICRKNCYYCGIRKEAGVERYVLTKEEVLAAARFAYENNYGSVVLQAGEMTSDDHVARIEDIIESICILSDNSLGITLSLGEQTPQTYKRWRIAGAHRYLLRIEASDRGLYSRLHPNDDAHSYDKRLKAITDLRDAGFQVGTGVIIGVPFQTVDNLADDILFMRELDIDMCGMGPYVLADDTPLANFSSLLKSDAQRVSLALNMIATLRIVMPDINIASATAMQALDPQGRTKAIEVGANVVMPNITPAVYRGSYNLYDNKPQTLENSLLNMNIRYGEKGDSKHFSTRKNEQ